MARLPLVRRIGPAGTVTEENWVQFIRKVFHTEWFFTPEVVTLASQIHFVL